MSRVCLFIICCLTVVTLVNAVTSVGERLPGDKLLLSEIIPRSITGKARLKRRFEGHIITRIETRVPRHLWSFFDLKILQGGVYANFVEVGVYFLNVISLRKRIRIYGMKVKPGIPRVPTTLTAEQRLRSSRNV